jgi:hypothetical protein
MGLAIPLQPKESQQTDNFLRYWLIVGDNAQQERVVPYGS